MHVDNISMPPDTVQKQPDGWRFRRKVTILLVVCCIAFLVYSLNCYRSAEVVPEVSATLHRVPSSDIARQSTVGQTHNKSDLRTDEGTDTQGTGGTDEDLWNVHEDVRKTEDKGNAKTSQDAEMKLSPTMSKEESYAVFLSSVDDDDDDDDDEGSEEDFDAGAALKPQGRWQQRLPQAIIIGVKKGGTRALLQFLKNNPQIVVVTKEMHFFDRQYGKGIEWYRKKMPNSYENQITMEKTPAYLVTPGVPRRIYNMSPDVKLLVVVRNPIQRAISDHAQSLSKGKTESFEEKALLNYRNCKVNEDWNAIQIGLYAEHLLRWLKYFSIDQFVFVSGENLVQNPGEEMEKVQDFLQVRRTITERSFFFNETKGFPCLKGDQNGEARCLGENKGRTHRPVDPRVMQCLKEFYKPYNQEFYKLTRKNFHWDD